MDYVKMQEYFKANLKSLFRGSVKYLSVIIALSVVLSCVEADEEAGQEFPFIFDFIIVNDAGEDYFVSDSTYFRDSVRVIDLQFNDTVDLNENYRSTELLTVGFYGEEKIYNYYGFTLIGKSFFGLSLPADYLLDYRNGDKDTITVTKENIWVNDQLLLNSDKRLPEYFDLNYIFNKN